MIAHVSPNLYDITAFLKNWLAHRLIQINGHRGLIPLIFDGEGHELCCVHCGIGGGCNVHHHGFIAFIDSISDARQFDRFLKVSRRNGDGFFGKSVILIFGSGSAERQHNSHFICALTIQYGRNIDFIAILIKGGL